MSEECPKDSCPYGLHHSDAENFILKAYRIWFQAAHNFDELGLINLFQHFQKHLGPQRGGIAYNSFVNYLSSFSGCAKCPIRYFEMNSPHICREECLFISLLSAVQNGDDSIARKCANSFCNLENHSRVFNSAGEFVFLLRSYGKNLFPVPDAFVDQVISLDAASEPSQRILH